MPAAMSSAKPSSSGMTLPSRAKGVGAFAGGGRTASITPAVRHGSDFTTLPRASITALMPVGVARSTGRPSSAARSRAWARCCGGPQRPNQASLDGLKMKSGRLRSVDDLAREDDLVAKLEADLAPCPRVDRARPGPGREIEVARAPGATGRSPRAAAASADIRRRARGAPCRSGRGSGRPGRARRRCSRRRRRACRRASERDAAGQQHIARPEQRCRARALELRVAPDARRCGHPRSGSVIAASGQSSRRGSPAGLPDSCGEPRAGFFGEAGAPLVLLADVRLDDADVADGQRIGGNRRGGKDASRTSGDAEDDDAAAASAAIIFEPDRAAEQDDQPGQAVGADAAAAMLIRRVSARGRPRPGSTGSR